MKPIAILILLLLVSLDLFGQSIYNLNRYEPEIIDGRAEALGRTSILSSNGANNVFNNPALLSELKSIDLQFNIRATFGNVNKLHTATDTTSIVDHYSDTDYKRTIHPKINGLSFGIPYQISPKSAWRFGFAAGYRAYYDWGYDIHEKRKEVFSDEITNEEGDNEFNGGFNTLVFGGGINYKKKFYAGVSISIPFNSQHSNIYEDFDGNKAKNSGTASGTFYTISGSYILSNYVTIGTRVKTEYKLEIDGSDDQFNITYNYKYTIPAEYGLALEVKPIIDLKIITEYITRNFADYDDLYYFNPESENGYSFRTGFEYGTNKIFRVGFFTQSVPVYTYSSYYDEVLDDYVFDLDDKPQTETGFTTGFGTKINSKIQINLFGSYSFLNYDEKYNFVADTDITNEVSYSLFKFGCSLGYSF